MYIVHFIKFLSAWLCNDFFNPISFKLRLPLIPNCCRLHNVYIYNNGFITVVHKDHWWIDRVICKDFDKKTVTVNLLSLQGLSQSFKHPFKQHNYDHHIKCKCFNKS